MQIDWDLFARIAVPFLTLFIGIAVNRVIERRPRLVTYLAHSSAITVPTEQPMTVHTHSIVVRNAGRSVALNVRLGHNALPAFSVYPPQQYEVNELQGGQEIVIPKLVPKEQITVAYLYFPPLIWNQINTYTKSDEGFAQVLHVLPTQQFPKWLSILIWFLIIVGSFTTLYFTVGFIICLFHRLYGG